MTTSDWHPHARGSDEPALGRDPFAEDVSIDPYIERIEALRQSAATERRKPVESDSRPRPEWTQRTVKKSPMLPNPISANSSTTRSAVT